MQLRPNRIDVLTFVAGPNGASQGNIDIIRP